MVTLPAPDSKFSGAMTHHHEPTGLPDAPHPRLSGPRVILALLVLVAVGTALGASVAGVKVPLGSRDESAAQAAASGPTWFAPYVDTTLTPALAFQQPDVNPAHDAVLGFVVAAPDEACRPSWGGYHGLDDAATALDLDRRVAQLRGRGGSAIVSFGGQRNDELAVACEDEGRLTDAYWAVAKRYGTDTLDFDIEGDALRDTAANARRAKAVRSVQRRAREAGGRLAVWVTLPVTPEGMRGDALAVVRSFLAAGVDLAGVNVMAMNLGSSDAPVRDMRDGIERATNATRGQVAAVYAQAGTDLGDAETWRKVGVTVMIGQNDVEGEQLSVAQARRLTRFFRTRGVGRVSMWSLNRDAQCGVTFPQVGVHSNLCSGVRQRPQQFSRTFARLGGSARKAARAVTSDAVRPYAATAGEDDPKRSPYPIWQPEQAYPADYKVVWRHAVYQARFYTQGDTPDAPAANGAEPWRLVGPVLRTDRAPKLPRMVKGTYPAWSADRTFRRGDKVLYRGLPYEAKWYTRGDVPGEPLPGGVPQPWQARFTWPGEPGPL